MNLTRSALPGHRAQGCRAGSAAGVRRGPGPPSRHGWIRW